MIGECPFSVILFLNSLLNKVVRKNTPLIFEKKQHANHWKTLYLSYESLWWRPVIAQNNTQNYGLKSWNFISKDHNVHLNIDLNFHRFPRWFSPFPCVLWYNVPCYKRRCFVRWVIPNWYFDYVFGSIVRLSVVYCCIHLHRMRLKSYLPHSS